MKYFPNLNEAQIEKKCINSNISVKVSSGYYTVSVYPQIYPNILPCVERENHAAIFEIVRSQRSKI